MNRSIAKTFAVMLALSGAATAHADEFGAPPGLWKTTLQILSPGNTEPTAPKVEWHCVDEDADPWIDFARLPETPPDACERRSFERTATTLQWEYSCRTPGLITSRGRLVFDAPQHYSGRITLDGEMLGYPLHSVTAVTGERLAACTSPKD
jgi:hypothetical protein